LPDERRFALPNEQLACTPILSERHANILAGLPFTEWQATAETLSHVDPDRRQDPSRPHAHGSIIPGTSPFTYVAWPDDFTDSPRIPYFEIRFDFIDTNCDLKSDGALRVLPLGPIGRAFLSRGHERASTNCPPGANRSVA
jgi:hypothetical protein